MVSFRSASLALSAVCMCLLVFASAALADGPASVTVRVEGAEKTLVPPTQVTTTTTPVVKDGIPADSCPGTSAAGALDVATGGNWGGTWYEKYGYTVESIEGETYLFSSHDYWEIWIDNKPATAFCEAELEPGDSLLLFPECGSGECPSPPNPLGIVAPEVVETGSPVTVKVTSYANASGAPSPAVGATVSGGEASATTGSNGEATLSFPSPGAYVVRASAPDSVRTETVVCVHNANDGTCGTSGSPGSSSGSSAGGVLGYSSSSYKGPYAVVAKLAGLIDNHHYPKGRAPRVLAGKVLAHTGIASVSLRLRRSYRGRCYAYNGASARFGPAHCGDGSFFKVGTQASFSYLLPESLAPGRYVLDVQATDAAGNRTTLARGTSRVVFYVR
jgi:hypothetical protein